MDYSVRYNIDINGSGASKELTSFLSTANKVIPKVNSKFLTLNKTLLATSRKIHQITNELRLINKSKINITSTKTINDLDKISRRLKRIKSKTVTVAVKQTGVGSKRSGFGGASRSGGGMFSPTSFMSAGGIPYATTIGAGLMGLALRNIISESVKFQDTMTTVHNILGVGQEDIVAFENKFTAVSKSIRKIGVDTKFSATEIADASKFLAMAGMSLDTIQKTMRPITSLAAIGNHDLGEVADVVTNIMAGYKIAGKDMGNVSDVIAYTATHSNTNVMEMAESFKYAGSYLSSVGVDFREASAAIGVLADSGRKGTLSGTGLRAMVIRLLKPTDRAAKVIDRLGLSFFKLGKNGKQEMKSLVEIFSEFKEVGASAQDITAIFDKVAGGAAMQLAKNVDKMRALTEASKTSGGLANFLAAEKMKTVAGLSDQIRSKFLDLGLNLYGRIEPTLKKIMNELLVWMKGDSAAKLFDSIADGIKFVIKGFKTLTQFVSGNWGWLKYVLGGSAAISGVMALTRALMLPLSAIGGVVGGMNRIGGSIAGLIGMSSSLATPIGAIAVAIAAAGTAAFFAYRKFTEADRIKKEFLESKNDENEGWGIFKSLDALNEKLKKITDSANESSGAMSDMLGNKTLESAVNKMSKSVGGFYEFGDRLFDKRGISATALRGQQGLLGTQAKSDANKFGKKAFFESLITGKSVDNILMGRINKVTRDEISGRSRGTNKLQEAYRGFTQGDDNNFSLTSMKDVRTGLFYLKEFKLEMERKIYPSTKNLQASSGTRGGLLSILEAQNVLPQGMASALGGISSSLLNRKTNKSDEAKRSSDLSAVMSDIQTRFPAFSIHRMKNMMVKMGFASKQVDEFLSRRLPALFNLTKTNIDSGGMFDKLKSTLGDEDASGASTTDGFVGAGNLRTGRAIIVNIDKLWNVENASFASESDLESLKSNIAGALVDVVSDFEISNF